MKLLGPSFLTSGFMSNGKQVSVAEFSQKFSVHKRCWGREYLNDPILSEGGGNVGRF